jgi:hypothetical protein
VRLEKPKGKPRKDAVPAISYGLAWSPRKEARRSRDVSAGPAMGVRWGQWSSHSSGKLNLLPKQRMSQGEVGSLLVRRSRNPKG